MKARCSDRAGIAMGVGASPAIVARPLANLTGGLLDFLRGGGLRRRRSIWSDRCGWAFWVAAPSPRSCTFPTSSSTSVSSLVSLCDAYPPVLEAVGERWGVARRYTDMAEFYASDALDAVVICHSGTHRDSVLAALAAGLHIFVEKPLVYNLREAEEIVAAAAVASASSSSVTISCTTRPSNTRVTGCGRCATWASSA